MPQVTRVLLAFLLAAQLSAQCPNTIVAGQPSTSSGDGQQATSAWLYQPRGLSLDFAGNLYIADAGNNRIRKVTTDGVMHTVAGPEGFNDPQKVLAAPDGSVYIADSGNHRIVRLSASGVLTKVAGTGHHGFSGDNGPAVSAELNYPTGMALDVNGRLYFADTNNARIRRIDANGVIATVAGGYVLPTPWSTDGYLGTGSTTSYAYYGFGVMEPGCCSVKDDTALGQQLSSPRAVAVAADGIVFFVDSGTGLRGITPDGRLLSAGLSGNGVTDVTLLPDGSPLLSVGDLLQLAKDGTGKTYRARDALFTAVGPSGIFYSSPENVIYRAATLDSEPVVYAGKRYQGNGPDRSIALGPNTGHISAMAAASDGALWVADDEFGRTRKALPDGTQRVVAELAGVTGISVDRAGNAYASSSNTVWRYGTDGTARLFGGGGYSMAPPLGAPAIPALDADLDQIFAIGTDGAGNVYVMSGGSQDTLVVRIAPSGQLTTVWDSTRSAAGISGGLNGLSVGEDGELLLAGYYGRILRVSASGAEQVLDVHDTIATIVRGPGAEIYYTTRDGRLKALASGATLYGRDEYLSSPYSPVVTNSQTSYIGGILTIQQPPQQGSSGGILITPRPYWSSPQLIRPIAADSQGNVYLYDEQRHIVLRFAPRSCNLAPAPWLDLSPVRPMGILTSWSNLAAPGQLISISGGGLGPSQGVSGAVGADGRLPTQLAGTRVRIDGVAAPLLYTSDSRIDLMVPFDTYGAMNAHVQVEYQGVLSDMVLLPIFDSAPTMFQRLNADSGPVTTVVNQDGTLNSPSNPAPKGSVVAIYGSGFGLTTQQGIDGHIASTPLAPRLPVAIQVDGMDASVLYAGTPAGMWEGMAQVNFRLPSTSDGLVTLAVGPAYTRFQIAIR